MTYAPVISGLLDDIRALEGSILFLQNRVARKWLAIDEVIRSARESDPPAAEESPAPPPNGVPVNGVPVTIGGLILKRLESGHACHTSEIRKYVQEHRPRTCPQSVSSGIFLLRREGKVEAVGSRFYRLANRERIPLP